MFHAATSLPKIVVLVISTIALVSIANADQNTTLGKGSIELGQLVREFMLKSGERPSWTMLATVNSPVRWTTDGVATAHDRVGTYRLGVASVTVDGESKQVLRQVVEELEWDVRLDSSGSERFGPESVTVEPNNSCFDSPGSDCGFEIASTLRNAGVHIQSLCRHVDRGSGVEVFAAKAQGKQPAWLLYLFSSGSGGTSNWITIYWNLDKVEGDARECLSEAGVAKKAQ